MVDIKIKRDDPERFKVIAARFTQADYDAIRKLAHENYTTMGAFIYQCIQVRLEKERNKNK